MGSLATGNQAHRLEERAASCHGDTDTHSLHNARVLDATTCRNSEPILESLRAAKSMLEEGRAKYSALLDTLRSDQAKEAFAHLEHIRANGAPLFAGTKPTVEEALLLLDLDRKPQERQQDLAERLGLDITKLRGHISHVKQALAEKCLPDAQETHQFINYSRNLEAAITYRAWCLKFTAWLRTGREEDKPQDIEKIPLTFLASLQDTISKRFYDRLRLHAHADNEEPRYVSLRAFHERYFLGVSIQSQGKSFGKIAVAVQHPNKKHEILRLRSPEEVAHGKNKPSADKIDSCARASGEFTRLALGSGPVDLDLTFGARTFSHSPKTTVSLFYLFSQVCEKIPHGATVPAYAAKHKFNAIQISLPDSAIAHLVTHKDLVGAEVWLLAHRLKKDDTGAVLAPTAPGTLVASLKITELSRKQIIFKCTPQGEAAKVTLFSARKVISAQVRQYFATGEGVFPEVPPLEIIPANGRNLARARFAGASITLPRRFNGDHFVPKEIKLDGGKKALGIFEVGTTHGEHSPRAICVMGLNGVWNQLPLRRG
jgi:hypothetical protein